MTAALALGCGASTGPENQGIKGAGGTSTNDASASSGGIVGGDGEDNLDFDPDVTEPIDTDVNDDDFCQSAEVNFVPGSPTAYLLVDRSSSMFESTDFWGKLKAGVLPMVESLQGDVRFGFGSYTGVSNSCTGLTEGAPIAGFNYDAISTAYNALGEPAEKSETPTALAVSQTVELLLADEAPGDKFILLVTDGLPDTCDDNGAMCSADAVIATLQRASELGIKTLVFGIENDSIQYPDWFDYFAQAGVGESPNWADGLEVGEYNGKMTDQCKGRPDWVALKDASPNNGEFEPAGIYSTAGGVATAFMDSDPAKVAERIQVTVSGLKSCTFDLTKSEVEVVAGQEHTGQIRVNDPERSGPALPLTEWRMNSSTELELLGAACELWKSEGVDNFHADFPCESIQPTIVL